MLGPPSGTTICIVPFSTPTFPFPRVALMPALGIFIVSDDSFWLLVVDLGNQVVVVEHMAFCPLGR